MQADTLKKTIRQSLLDQNCGKKWVSQIKQFLTTLYIKGRQLEVHKRIPPTSCQISGNAKKRQLSPLDGYYWWFPGTELR
jgi:hypothetical protein